MNNTTPRLLISILFCLACFLGAAQENHYRQQFEERLNKAKGVEKAEVLLALITMYAGINSEKAEDYNKQLQALSNETNDPAIKVLAQAELAHQLRKTSYRDSARLLLLDIKRMTRSLENESLSGHIDLRLGLVYNDLRKEDSAIYCFESARNHYRQSGELHNVALSLAYLGSTNRVLGNNQNAGLYLDSASQLIARVLTTDSSYWPLRFAAVIANYQSIYKNAMGRYEAGLQSSLQALTLFEKVGDTRSEAATLIAAGNIYRKLAQYPAAMLQFRRAAKAFNTLGDQNAIGVSYEGIAMVFDDLHQVDSAKLYFEKALTIASAAGNKRVLGTLYNNMGAMYYNAKAYAQADEYYEKAFAIRGGEEKATPYDHATAMINLGQTAFKLGNMTKAANYLTKGLRIAHELHLPEFEKSALEGLIEYHKAMKNYQQALAYQDTLLVVKDSLFVADSKTRIAEMQVKYETEKKEQEIALLQIESYNAELKQRFWMGGLLVSVIVSLLGFYTLRNRKARMQAELLVTRKEKELIEGQLSYKDKELVNFATFITEKNDFLETVLQRLDSLDVSQEAGKKQLDNLILLIRDHMNLTGSREEFNAHLSTVYESFIQKLEDRYPDLTEHEKRLATLLRVNLTSKQIASVFNISPKSVDMGRYRLRKKMGLNNDQDIHQILNNI